MQTFFMLSRRVCQFTFAPGSPIFLSLTSGRTEIAGRLFQLIRMPDVVGHRLTRRRRPILGGRRDGVALM